MSPSSPWGLSLEHLPLEVEFGHDTDCVQAVRCANGDFGKTTIRRGRREVVLSPIGALTFYFDPPGAVANVARLAQAVADASSLEEANDLLHAVSVMTELDFERQMLEA